MVLPRSEKEKGKEKKESQVRREVSLIVKKKK